MFLDEKRLGPRPEPLPQRPVGPRLTPREERTLVWVIALNVLLLFVAPIGGATLLQWVFAVSIR